MIVALNTGSAAYDRMAKAGFKILTFDILRRVDLIAYPLQLRIQIQCVCGAREESREFFDNAETFFQIHSSYNSKKGYDAAQWLEDIGTFSEAHLRKDGFTEGQIERIRRPYAA